MKMNGLVIAVLVLGALTGVLYWSNHHQPPADAGPAPPNTGPALFTLNDADITKFDLKKNGVEQAELSREGNSNDWEVSSPVTLPAAPDAISGLMTVLAKLTSERLVDAKPADLKLYGLAQPAYETDILTKDGKTYTLLLGEDGPAGQVTYAMLGGDPRVFTVPGYVKDVVNRTPRDLRDKRLLTLDADKITRVDLNLSGKGQMQFVRENGQWQMAQPKSIRADAAAIDNFVDNLAQAQMDPSAISQDAKAAGAGFSGGTPVATARVTSDSGTQTLEIRKNKDVYYAKVPVGEGIYKISSATSEGIAKTADDFRNKKLFDFGDDDPDKVEMRDGAKSYVLAKSGTDWLLDGNKVDASAAQEFVGKLRSLVANKFPDSGFASPAISLTVTSGGGKHVEKVEISKSGTSAIGKRENEPALYELDSTLVDEMEKSAADIKPAAAK